MKKPLESHITTEDMEKGLTLSHMEHIAECSHCCSLYADYLEQKDLLLNAPMNMKSEILQKSSQVDIQFIAKSNLASKKLQLLFYSLKVTAAVSGALFCLLMGPQIQGSEPYGPQGAYQGQTSPQTDVGGGRRVSLAGSLYNTSRSLANYIYSIPEQLLNLEVNKYDAQER